MKTFHKFLCLIVILSVLISIVVIPSSASGAYDESIGAFAIPFAFPSSAVCYNSGSSNSVLFDSNFTVGTPASNSNFSYSQIHTYGFNGFEFIGLSNTSVNGTPYVGYDVSYFQGTASFSNSDVLNGANVDRLQLLIPSFFIPGNLANSSQNSWNWLGNWYVTDIYNDSLLATRYRLRYNIKYVDYVGNSFVLKSMAFDYDVGQDVLTSSQKMYENIRSTIRSSLPIGAPSRGILFDFVSLTFYDVDFIDGFEYGGNCKYVSSAGGGNTGAVDKWSVYFSSAAPVNQLTILGSIADGLRDVFNLTLFGEFTIGALFSVMVAIPLTIWILKLFAGG